MLMSMSELIQKTIFDVDPVIEPLRIFEFINPLDISRCSLSR
jgi:hypothetical protein